MTPKRHAIAKEIIKLLYPGPPFAASFLYASKVLILFILLLLVRDEIDRQQNERQDIAQEKAE